MTCKKVWRIKSPSPDVFRLANEANLTLLQAHLLMNRGICSGDDAMNFLNPRLSTLPHPMELPDMEAAVSMILRAMEGHECITIYGDYDVDGLTSTALLYHFFKSFGVRTTCYVPDRLKEGYGLNERALKNIAKAKGGLLITVDCGTSNQSEVVKAKELGLDIVVTDHHQVPKELIPVCPMVNPHRSGSPRIFKVLSGVGLAFFLAAAVRAELRKHHLFKRMQEPDMREFLDLVALGTLADQVPVAGLNRTLVSKGIHRMAGTSWPGLGSVIKMLGIQPSELTYQDLLYLIAPRINAPGRLGSAKDSLDLLTLQESGLGERLAVKMNAANQRRKSIEKSIMREIDRRFETRPELTESRKILFVGGEGWHRGVLGIIASKLVEKYHRPTLVFAMENGIASGSGRSVSGFHLHEALSREGHLLDRFGGHAYAAGFTCQRKNLDALEKDLETYAASILTERDFMEETEIDGVLPFYAILPSISKEIAPLGPFGPGNHEPVFLSETLEVVSSRIVGEGHLKVSVRQGRKVLEGIGFGLGIHYPLDGEKIRMLFLPQLNRWQGRERLEVRIVDLEKIQTGSRTILEDPGRKINVFGAENKEGFFTAREG